MRFWTYIHQSICTPFLGIYRGTCSSEYTEGHEISRRSSPSVNSKEISDKLVILGISSEICFLGIPSENSEGFSRKEEIPKTCLVAPSFLHPPLEAALLSHIYGGNWVSSIVTPSVTSSIAIPSPSRSAAVSALSDVVRSPLSAAVFVVPSEALSPPEPPDPPPCLPFPVPFEALSPPEPPDPPDASCRLFVHLHVDTPFTLSQAFSKIRNLETPFPNLTSGGVVSFVFFGATRIGSKCLYPAPPSRMATKNVGGGGLLAYRLHSPVVYRSPFGCVDDTSFAYGLHSPVIYMSLFGCSILSMPSICPNIHHAMRPMPSIKSTSVRTFFFVFRTIEINEDSKLEILADKKKLDI
ncbi:BnaC03g63490D [Brassica napus]|uniref:BnaC03g63490D protein n=1 Tax=Brassica napus TaxID=3708 RepID=A0A078F8F6_BRANA|nr:BnaC03g63490D [Brassica napus]